MSRTKKKKNGSHFTFTLDDKKINSSSALFSKNPVVLRAQLEYIITFIL